MKFRFSILAVVFAFISLSAVAQTETKPAQEAPKAGGAAPGKTIPVAEYYDGGQEAMYAFINKELNYPIMAKRNRIQGQCIISFTVNEDGVPSGYKIVKEMGGGTGAEALRVVKMLKFNAPGYPILVSLPVNFKL